MTDVSRYGKPNMTNLPPELGRAIFTQILNTPKPDRERLHQEALKLEKQMVMIRDRKDAKRNSAKFFLCLLMN